MTALQKDRAEINVREYLQTGQHPVWSFDLPKHDQEKRTRLPDLSGELAAAQAEATPGIENLCG